MSDTNHILKLAHNYEKSCLESLDKLARIKKLPSGKYRVLSENGKNLGTSETKEEAEKRLKQVEYFKHNDKNSSEDEQEEKVIDLMKATDFSYSAIMREMRQKATKEQVREFLILFKREFDKATKDKLQKPEKLALQNSLIKFNKRHKIKVKKKLVKNAAISELGDANQVGQYLANIVRFTINRIPLEKRQSVISNLKNKFYSFNADEIAQKQLPPTSSIGQSITFVKHVLFNHDPIYIREVLNSLVSHL
jgi:hypothetical protein